MEKPIRIWVETSKPSMEINNNKSKEISKYAYLEKIYAIKKIKVKHQSQ